MSRPRTPNNAVCPNPDCEYHLLVEGKDIRKQGKNSAGHQRFQCMHCKAFFVETANTPMYRRHISEEELILIGKLLVEKVGNRAMSRITGLTPVTISRVIDAITLHATKFNALMAGKAGVGQVELDEMWTFVKNDFFTKNRVKTALRGGFGFVVVRQTNKKMWTKEQQIQISKAMHGFISESSEIQSS